MNKKLNIVRKIVLLPFSLVVIPMVYFMGFLMTNWEKESDRKFFKETIKDMFKLFSFKKEEVSEEHDCHASEEDGCSHPSHQGIEEKVDSLN